MTSIPYGLRDIKLTPYTDAVGTTLAASGVDLPNARTLSFTESEDYDELRGDDRVVARHGQGPTVNIDFEAGGLSLEALVILNGGAIVTSGTGSTQVKTYSKKVTDSRPYFKIEGQAISDSGGDVHCIIYRAKADGDISGEFGDGEFFLTSGSAVGLGSLVAGTLDKLYDFVENATVTAIA